MRLALERCSFVLVRVHAPGKRAQGARRSTTFDPLRWRVQRTLSRDRTPHIGVIAVCAAPVLSPPLCTTAAYGWLGRKCTWMFMKIQEFGRDTFEDTGINVEGGGRARSVPSAAPRRAAPPRPARPASLRASATIAKRLLRPWHSHNVPGGAGHSVGLLL